MNYDAWQSLPALFFANAQDNAGQNFLWSKKKGGVYVPLTWRQVEIQVKDLSRGLRHFGLDPGDRVVLVSENRPEWFAADFAIMAARGITVPAYTTNTVADHAHILTHSGARGAIVSTRALAAQLLPAALQAPDCEWLIAMEDPGSIQPGPLRVEHWDSATERGRSLPDDVEAVAGQAGREDVACFIYTSGTGGVPKGVMLSHRAMFCNCVGAFHLLQSLGFGREVFLSFLPLSHSYEHTVGQMFAMSIAAEIYYAEGAEHLLRNLAECRPTIMTAVPRLYEAMHQRISRGIEKESEFKRKLFGLALDLGRKRYADPASLTLVDRLLDHAVDRLVRHKVRQRFGGRLKAMVSGGAALNADVGIFFTALGLRILQGYGQTEAAPVISANPPGLVKMHTVGPPLKGVEVRIAEDGEVLVRGDLLMSGYWQDEAATAAAIKDGWLHTGDVGEIDADGYLKITDRKKDILVMSGGDNVSPARIESFLSFQPEIAQAMVYGDKRPHLVALIVLDSEFLKSWRKYNKRKENSGALNDDAALREAVGAAIDRVNRELSNLERIRRFLIADEAFTVDNKMMTPTLKIRRHKIIEVYGTRLEALYGSGK